MLVMGMTLRTPDILRMSSSPPMACMTEPAERKRSALKKAWVKTWKTAEVEATDTEAQEHVAELREGGVGPDVFEVVLAEWRWRQRGRR